MTKRFSRNWIVGITLATTLITSTGNVWAEQPQSPNGDSVELDLGAALENVSDEAIGHAVDSVNTQLNEAATDNQKEAAQVITAQLSQDSQKPGFKQRLISIVKETGHVGGKAGVILLTTTGVVGSAVLATSIAPLAIGANFFTTLLSGKGMIATHYDANPADLDQDPVHQFGGEVVGAVGEAYLLSAIIAVGGSPAAWGWCAALLEKATQGLICSKQNQGPNLKRYCHLSESVYDHILFAEAITGDVLGETVRYAFILPIRLIGKLFHHHRNKTIVPVASEVAPVAYVCDPGQISSEYGCLSQGPCPTGSGLVDGTCVAISGPTQPDLN